MLCELTEPVGASGEVATDLWRGTKSNLLSNECIEPDQEFGGQWAAYRCAVECDLLPTNLTCAWGVTIRRNMTTASSSLGQPRAWAGRARRQNQMLLFGITNLCRITYFKRFKTYCYGIRMEGRIMSDPLPKRRLGTSFDGEIRGSKSPKGSYRRKLQPNSRQVNYTSRGKISIDG